MKLIGVVLLLALLSGCSDYFHAKSCLPADKEGYQWCHHTIEYWDETKCVGTCKLEGGRQ